MRAVLTAAFLAGFAWLVLHRHEPYYHGKPLSFWLEDAYRSQAYEIEGAAPDAEGAVRELGAGALPDLMRLLRSANYVPEQIMGDMSHSKQFAFLHLPGADYRQPMVPWAFRRLGPEAKSAVPELIELLASKDSSTQQAAAQCLAALGPCAEPAVPALLAAWKKDVTLQFAVLPALREIGPGARAALPQLAVADPMVAEFTKLRITGESILPFVEGLRNVSPSNSWATRASLVAELGTNGEPAIPLILSAVPTLLSTNTTDLIVAIGALGQIHRRPDICVPAIIPFLKSPDTSVRCTAIRALGLFGVGARSATAEIAPCLSDGHPLVNQSATNALRVIDPAALVNAGKSKSKW